MFNPFLPLCSFNIVSLLVFKPAAGQTHVFGRWGWTGTPNFGGTGGRGWGRTPCRPEATPGWRTWIRRTETATVAEPPADLLVQPHNQQDKDTNQCTNSDNVAAKSVFLCPQSACVIIFNAFNGMSSMLPELSKRRRVCVACPVCAWVAVSIYLSVPKVHTCWSRHTVRDR